MKTTKNIKRATLDELRKIKAAGEIKSPGPNAKALPLPEGFWENATPFLAPEKTSVHLRLDSDVFEWFKAQGKGHLTRMNAVLRSYYEARRKKLS